MIDALFEQAKRKKLRISNFFQGTNGNWYCLVHKGKKIHGVAFADNPITALTRALDGHSYIEKTQEQEIADQFADLL